MGQSVQQVVPLPVYTDARPVIHTVVPPVAYARHIPQYEDQHHMYQTVNSTVPGDEVRFEDFREVKENMQLLEKKFRDLEGDHVFGSAAKEMCLVSRELASQVEPPLAEKELAELFIDTVQPQFYGKMVGSASLGFSKLVSIGARVEYCVRNGKLATVAGTSNANQKKFSGGFPRKKEGENKCCDCWSRKSSSKKETITIFTSASAQAYQASPVYRPAPVQQRVTAPPAYQQAPVAPIYQQLRAQVPRQNAQNQNRRKGDMATFNPIPMSYTELYPSLLQKGLVVPRPMGSPPDRLPPCYNPNAHCPFHEGAPGHDLEGCYTLKHRIHELIESKILSFKDMGPNVKNNPRPPRGDPAVNAIEDASIGVTVDKVDDVKTPLAAFHARLVEAGLVNVNHENFEECAIYPKGCQVVRDNIQDLMDKGVLQISSAAKYEDVLVIEPCFNLPEPVEIPYYNGGVVLVNSKPSPVEICMPTYFPYESTKVVSHRCG
ncbi:uncharacterized protein LOC127121612 [Lathyrus oleraceus]|uniref:uncharacterized protein LOC127121612 n=1 Tax=Pisum sativum TaxID=3888 RepID=UPI0021CFF130|nr:uncharacterized protein LOC127121612 [Pisum sativum]